MLKKISLLLFTVLFLSSSFAQQTKEELQRKQQDLQKEIADLSKTLAEIQGDKKKSIQAAQVVQRKIKAREELVNNINRDLRRLDDNIYLNQIEIYRLNKELDTLKQQYAQSIVFAYKNRSNYNYLNFLFSAKNFNDALKRFTYLKSYRQYRETQANSILKTQDVLVQKNNLLNENKTERGLALNEQTKQLSFLETDKKEKERVVTFLKSQEKDIAKQIQAKERERQKMRQMVLAIIKRDEEEARKKEQARLKAIADAERNKPKANTSNPTATNKPVISNKPREGDATEGLANTNKGGREYSVFESTPEGVENSKKFELKGLPWPVDAGYVSIPFGSYTIPETKLKGVSDGIEISMQSQLSVKSVADGVVSGVSDIGDGQAVFVRYGKYVTMYTYLTNVNVSKDQAVKAGTVLGKATPHESGGYKMFFMIMNEHKSPQNPLNWLKRR